MSIDLFFSKSETILLLSLITAIAIGGSWFKKTKKIILKKCVHNI